MRLFNKLWKQGIIKINSTTIHENIEEKTTTGPKNITTTTKTKDVTSYDLTISEQSNTPQSNEFEQLLADKPLSPDQLKDLDKLTISIKTRSIMQTLVLLSKSGMTVAVKDSDESKSNFKIEFNTQRPNESFVTIKHRGIWYYIDSNDDDSKNAFSLMVSILAMSESGSK